MRRERDALALRIAESQETIERSKDLLRRIDRMLAAYGGQEHFREVATGFP